MRLIDFITEGVGDNYLYHSTNVFPAARIVNQDHLAANTEQRSDLLTVSNKHVNEYGRIRGISLTRSLTFAKAWRKEGVIFVLDANKLRQRYLIKPFIYYRTPDKIHTNKREAEEFVVGQNGIKPFSKYLVKILIDQQEYDYLKSEVDSMVDPEESVYFNLVNHRLLEIL